MFYCWTYKIKKIILYQSYISPGYHLKKDIFNHNGTPNQSVEPFILYLDQTKENVRGRRLKFIHIYVFLTLNVRCAYKWLIYHLSFDISIMWQYYIECVTKKYIFSVIEYIIYSQFTPFSAKRTNIFYPRRKHRNNFSIKQWSFYAPLDPRGHIGLQYSP